MQSAVQQQHLEDQAMSSSDVTFGEDMIVDEMQGNWQANQDPNLPIIQQLIPSGGGGGPLS